METNRNGRIVAFWLALGALGGCAAHTEVSTGRTYGPEESAIIMRMRADGDGLADVARVVGGTRADVRAAEKRARGCHRQILLACRTERLP
jgi:hypothetical protein